MARHRGRWRGLSRPALRLGHDSDRGRDGGGRRRPGAAAQPWGFDGWLGHDSDTWERLLDDADGRCETGLAAIGPVQGSDADTAAISIATECVKRPGLAGRVGLSVAALADAAPAAGFARGLVACNPPYGERLSDKQHLPRSIASRFACQPGGAGSGTRRDPSGTELAAGLGVPPQRVHQLYNGRILAPVSVFAPDSRGEALHGVRSGPTPAAVATAPDQGAAAFENRLRKTAKHLGGWARKSGVTCWRIYDADLPDYDVAVDTVRERRDGRARGARRRVRAAGRSRPRAGGRAAASGAMFRGGSARHPGGGRVRKRRERQRGASQYQRSRARA